MATRPQLSTMPHMTPHTSRNASRHGAREVVVAARRVAVPFAKGLVPQ